jgi:hypothetical protein
VPEDNAQFYSTASTASIESVQYTNITKLLGRLQPTLDALNMKYNTTSSKRLPVFASQNADIESDLADEALAFTALQTIISLLQRPSNAAPLSIVAFESNQPNADWKDDDRYFFIVLTRMSSMANAIPI